MFDYHMHTKSSFDSTAEPADMAKAAKNAGLSEICLTNHVDINHVFPKGSFPFDLNEIAADYASVKEGVDGVTVKYGVELGVETCTAAEYEQLLDKLDFDFIICSQHFVNGIDPFFGDEYFSGKTLREAFVQHLLANLEVLRRFKRYSVVGHLGYPAKYCKDTPTVIGMSDYGDIIDEILKTVIADGKGIEVNTSGIAITGEPMAAYSVVARFLELGGEIVTMGSDSHDPSRVGDRFHEVRERLLSIGLKYVCTFSQMNPEFHLL